MLDVTDTTTASVGQPQAPGATTRRAFTLSGMATAVAGFLAVPSIEFLAPANDDANVDSIDLVLIQLCDSIVAVRGEQDRLQQIMYDLIPGDPDHDPTFDRIVALHYRARDLAKQVGRLPARTMAGVQARAAAIQVMMPVDHGDGDRPAIDWHHGMLDALLRDLTEGVDA